MAKEYNKRITAATNFILKNSSDRITLKNLAGVANYSPFHFQKIFKNLMGESPKQFIIRIRLGNAAHSLIVHRHMTISQIAFDSGFASPSTFARAFKNYFGITPDELRSSSIKKRTHIRGLMKWKRNVRAHSTKNANAAASRNFEISIVKSSSIRLAFLNASLSNLKQIEENFRKIFWMATAQDILTPDTKFIGIINPHSGLYQTAISLSSYQLSPKDLTISEIESGKFAVCQIEGDTIQIFQTFHTLFENWLPESGYRIKGHFAFEILLQNPSKAPYSEIKRDLYIPIEPA